MVDGGLNDADGLANGVLQVVNVLMGTYTITETVAPPGYALDDVASRSITVSSLDLNAVVGVQGSARAVTLYSHDGAYTESLTLEQVEQDEVMVATHLDGAVITRDHGGPVRLLVVPMYGYKSLKWLSRIELVESVDPGYWEERGYDVDAYVGSSNGRNDAPIT